MRGSTSTSPQPSTPRSSTGDGQDGLNRTPSTAPTSPSSGGTMTGTPAAPGTRTPESQAARPAPLPTASPSTPSAPSTASAPSTPSTPSVPSTPSYGSGASP